MNGKTPTPKGPLGIAYDKASKSEKLRFVADLYDAQVRLGMDYKKAFDQTWQFKKNFSRLAAPIRDAAIKHLGFIDVPQTPASNELSVPTI